MLEDSGWELKRGDESGSESELDDIRHDEF